MGIILGVNATYPRKGVGNVTPQLNEGSSIHLQNLFYVHDRKKNLVSISAMEVMFKGGIHRWKGMCLKIEFSKMLLLVGLGLAICIKLQKVHW